MIIGPILGLIILGLAAFGGYTLIERDIAAHHTQEHQ
jgi:hypothetical protein